MSGIGFPNNLNPETTKVLDNRCAGTSSGTNSITYPAQGLLRYETDTDNWKYYDNTNNWVNFSTGVTYTSGEGISISPSNVISIGQPVDETDDVTFNSVTTNSVKGQNNGDLEFRTITSSVENVRMTITNTGRVGINVAANDIEEDFEIDGNIQLDTGGAQRSRIIFYDKQNDHEHAEVDGLGEGTNGGVLALYTKVDGGSVTEKLRINNVGAIGIGGANYGTTNQVLISNGSGSAVTWANQIDTLDDLGDVTLTAVTTGDLLKYNGTNFINFAPTYLDGAGISDNYLIKVVGGATTQTSFIETSVANTSTSLKTYIPGTPLSVLAGSIETEFFNTTKRRMHLTTSGIETANGITITSDGKVGIGVVEPDEILQIDGKLRIEDDTTQTLTFYDTYGGSTKEHARIEVDDDGGGADILFYTRPSGGNPPTEKLRINKTGAIGIAGANYGSSGQVLTSQGSGSSVVWSSPSQHILVTGSSINAGIYNYINFKDIVNSSSNYTRYDFFRVPRISGIYTVRLMKLKIQTEYWNEAALYQEEIVRWNDRTNTIISLNVIRMDNILPLTVSTNGVAPTLNATNSGKIWVWEDNTNVYVSFINVLNRSHRMLIHMELFNVRHADGGYAVVL